MGILLAFAPFITFAVLDRLAGPTIGLAAAAVVAIIMMARDIVSNGRPPKVLEIGTLVLFGGLALYSVLGDPAWSLAEVRLCVDAGLLLIVLATLLAGRPFTLQYAREQAPPEVWADPVFIRINYVITGIWALAFAVMVAADLAFVFLPHVPRGVGILATIVALVGAIKFTTWYPAEVRARRQATN